MLITGAGGLLGSKVVEIAENSYEVVPTHNTRPLFKNSVKMDIKSADEVLRIITRLTPDIVSRKL